MKSLLFFQYSNEITRKANGVCEKKAYVSPLEFEKTFLKTCSKTPKSAIKTQRSQN